MTHIRKLATTTALLFALTASVASTATAATQTLTGVITDDMCGKKHTMMPGKPDADCIRACVKAGSKYALLSGDKMYALKGDTRQIAQLAGRRAKVSGEVNGAAISVSSIAPAQ